jgi:cobalt-zinc-cadmium efflux system outer membrane protein
MKKEKKRPLGDEIVDIETTKMGNSGTGKGKSMGMGRGIKSLIALALILWIPVAAFGCTLSWEEAVTRTLQSSPRLKISWGDVSGAAGVQIQSGLLPNPILSYSVENLFGNGSWRGWRSAESRYEIAQLIELGGKRCCRLSSATYQLYAAQASYEAEKMAVQGELLKCFIDTATLQEDLELAQEQKRITEEIFKTVSAKVEDGKVSLIQKHKAEIALASAKIHFERSAVEFLTAKDKLAAFWGASCSDFDQVEWGFYELEVPDDLDECLLSIPCHPELLQAQFENLSAHQFFHLQKAEAIPDLTLLVGYKTFHGKGDGGFILGASLPLPIFDRNQGNVAQSLAVSHQTQDQYEHLQLLLENKLIAAHKELVRAFGEAHLLRSTLLKVALEAFELAQVGYQEGKFEYLDLLDSKRTLFEVMERYIEALRAFHQSKAEIEYLHS